VQLVDGAIGLFQRTGGKSDFVALGGKFVGDSLAYIAAGPEDKNDRGH
jgi:hypothetical protein